MNQENGVVTIQFDDGNWWKLKADLTRGDVKRLNQLQREWIELGTVSAEELRADPARGVRLNYAKMDLDRQDDLLLALGTVAWSFEPQPYQQAFVDTLPSKYVETAIAKANELYGRHAQRGALEAQLADQKKD